MSNGLAMSERGLAISVLFGIGMILATLLAAGLSKCGADHETEIECLKRGGTMYEGRCFPPGSTCIR